jgi:hypothetical protein
MATANTAVLTQLDANVHSLAEMLEVYYRDGGVIVLNMLSDEIRNNLRSELAEIVVELRGIEPLTSCMPCKRSTN